MNVCSPRKTVPPTDSRARDLDSLEAEAAPIPVLTRDRILDAAEELFAERGLAGTAVRDISNQVGLTPASLYNHFSGKQSLYEAVLDRGVRPLVGLMQSLPEAVPADSTDIIAAIMEHLGRRPHLPALIQHEVMIGGANLVRLAHSWVEPMVEHGIAAMRRDPDSPWDEDEYPLLIGAWLSLVLGHFTLAPMTAEVFGDDPLSQQNLARQTRFLRKLARLVMNGPRPPAAEASRPAGATQ
jgi:AcrR family transcriptional regulator